MDEPDAQEQKLRAPRKPRRCPSCKHDPVSSILYGMPAYDEDMQRKIETGHLVLGGCVVSEDHPSWKCTGCGLEIWRELPLGYEESCEAEIGGSD